ncbi:MAG: helix-hairpin-helix domain-containing protein, partial [Gemmatimonadetes bacterium]|nr:helix-hairpin-helix domain-containing protein [Gemmatimonadota bacterium]
MTNSERWVVWMLVFLLLLGAAGRRLDISRGGTLPWSVPDSTGAEPAPDEPAEKSVPLVVDLNRCDREELETLPGLGPSKAAAVIAWREEKGPFETVDELLAVPGIGPKTLERLKPHLSLER